MDGHKVALITDTHFGVRKGSQIFHDYFEKFYNETVFPRLDSRGIKSVIHLGDVFDVRKGIDYWSLSWAKRVFFGPLQERGISTHVIVGNHDIFYKNSLDINAPQLNLREYDNVSVYDSPQTINIDGVEIFVVPWICEGNADMFMKSLRKTKSGICMGHLELAGFYANKDYQCQHGTDPKVFNQFDRVFSGHFHKKSTRGNVTYLGNPYQIYWNDEGETRGFHIFDLDTKELEFFENPTNMFHKIYYNEDKVQLIEPDKLTSSYIKLIVEKSSPKVLNKVVDSLYEVGIHDLKIIENIDFSIDDDAEIESEDTLTTLTNYVNAMEEEVNKENLINIFKTLYIEAQEV